MKTNRRNPSQHLTRNLLAFSGGFSLPPWLRFIRHCTRPCRLEQMPQHHQAFAKWTPSLIPPGVALFLGRHEAGWIYMWLIVIGLFASAKWIAFFPILIGRKRTPLWKLVAFLFLWPGMNAKAFCFGEPSIPPKRTEWAAALAKIALGGVLLALATRLVQNADEMLAGWIGMIGIVFVLHFGLFHLLSVVFRTAAIDAPPIMQMPVTATSLTKFWNGRWNRGFTDLMQRHVFLPLARKFDGRVAVLGVFLISGLLHESVISVPARAGYGLPTGYFVLQGIGQALERSEIGRRVDLSHGWKGWSFVALVAGVPALILFPPVFIHNVMVPMLKDL